MSAMSASISSFSEAQNKVKTLQEDPGNQVKLQLYALFKQAKDGPCNVPKPGMMDFVGKAKWEAWKAVGDVSHDAARDMYIKLVEDLVSKDTPVGSETVTAAGDQMSTHVITKVIDNVHLIKLNRPEKKNALVQEMYTDIVNALKVAGSDSTSLTVFTGTGDYYCSGNDLSNLANIAPQDIPEMAKQGEVLFRDFVDAFIDFPKPIVALVNGPAVGISVTTLGLFDLVYATDRATFWSPFTSLGQSPEGCSSYLFPKIMGYAQASQLLLFNQRLTAHAACRLGIVTEVFPDHIFQQEAWNRITDFASLPKQSLRLSKQLLRAPERDILHETNRREAALLAERWQSDECFNAIMKFFQSKL
ncbi:hypothetical protein NP493_1339g00023 [Ridgeia piscesae]|uniref:ACB domain-containing protein n=1 Tax=Ridgeia piscesae TaxID=27915 RepID=A0AAD9K7F4_RIDPI|nr:hypothetical protein NP493_1339g00023 [Ridgeia piscesae]